MKSDFERILSSIKEKPYFKADSFALYKEDCLNVLKKIPTNSIDMIFADPPYNLSNGGFTVQSGKQVSVNKGKWDESKGFKEDLKFHVNWIKACKRVLKPEGTIWVSGTYHSIYQCGYALQLNDYHVLNDITWFKPNAAPNISGRYFAASHETLIWAKKDKKAKHTFNYKLMKEGNFPEDFVKNPGKQMRSVWAFDDRFSGDEVWVITTPSKREKEFGKHPTQKPIALLRRIISAATNPGDIVLDPFTGSSTTGLVAINSGRNFIGIDTQEEYLNLSASRLKGKNKELFINA